MIVTVRLARTSSSRRRRSTGASEQATRRAGHAAARVVLGAQRREAGGEVGRQDLVDVLGLDEVAQPVLAEVEERDAGGEVVGHQVGGGAAHHDLAAVGDVVEAGGAVHGGPEPVAVALLGLAAVQPHPDPERVRPASGSLPRERWAATAAATPAPGSSNTAATPSPRNLNTAPSWSGDHLRQEPVVLGQVVAHRGGRGLPEPRAALDVREQERPGGVHRRLLHGPSLARRGSPPGLGQADLRQERLTSRVTARVRVRRAADDLAAQAEPGALIAEAERRGPGRRRR